MAMGSSKRDSRNRLRGSMRSKKHGKPQEHSSIQEANTARRFGGRTTKGSGNTTHDKGDVVTREFLFENKTTEAKSMSVKGAWLEKISNEAIQTGRDPALEIEIRGITDGLTEKQWIMVPSSVMARLLEES